MIIIIYYNPGTSKKKKTFHDLRKSSLHHPESNAEKAAPGVFKLLLSHIDHHIAPIDSIARAVPYPRAVQRNLIKGLAT